MTIETALRHAGNLHAFSEELMAEITECLPGYLWIVDNFAGDVGLPEFDDPDPRHPARYVRCGVCAGDTVEQSRHGRYRIKYPQNAQVSCPFCKQEVTVKHVSRGVKGLEDRANVVFFRKSVIDPEAVVALAARVQRIFYIADRLEPWTLEPDVIVRGVAVFDPNNRDDIRIQTRVAHPEDGRDTYHPTRLTGIVWKRVKAMDRLGFGDDGLFPYQRPVEYRMYGSLERAIQGTPFQRAWHEAYFQDSQCVSALDMIVKYPCVEYLTKLGLPEYVTGRLDGSLPPRLINWNGKSMSDVLKLSRERLGQAKGKGIPLTPTLCAVLQYADRQGIRCGIETAEGVAVACQDERRFAPELLKSAIDLFAPQRRGKAMKYVARNRERSIRAIRDLWEMTLEAGGSLNSDEDAFPRDFRQAHDRLAERLEAVKNAEADRRIQARYKALEDQYGFEFGGLILRPAASAAEVVREGQALHHCVARYVSKYAAGDTVICVLRRAVQPDMPWRTVEISAQSGTVVQDRGLHNDWGERYYIDDTYRAMLALFWEAWRERKKNKRVRVSA